MIIVSQPEMGPMPSERGLLDHMANMRKFCGGGLQKFLSPGRIKEEIVHFDLRAMSGGATFNRGDFSSTHHEVCPHLILPPGCQETKLGNRGNTRQGFTPEAIGRNSQQILLGAHFAGRKSLARQLGIRSGHALPIIRYPDQPLSPIPGFDGNDGAPGVQAVVD